MRDHHYSFLRFGIGGGGGGVRLAFCGTDGLIRCFAGLVTGVCVLGSFASTSLLADQLYSALFLISESKFLA